METKVELKRPKGLPLAVQKKGRSLESYPDAKTKTERVGYTDFSKRMAHVELAGENLRQYRADAQLYDATGETDIDKIDWQQVRVRSLGFGLAEYSMYQKAVAERKAQLYERIGQAKKAKAIKEALAAKEKREADKASAGGTPADGSGPSGPGGVQGAAHAPASNQ